MSTNLEQAQAQGNRWPILSLGRPSARIKRFIDHLDESDGIPELVKPTRLYIDRLNCKQKAIIFLIVDSYWVNLIRQGIKVKDIPPRDSELGKSLQDRIDHKATDPNWKKPVRVGSCTLNKEFLLSLAKPEEISQIKKFFRHERRNESKRNKRKTATPVDKLKRLKRQKKQPVLDLLPIVYESEFKQGGLCMRALYDDNRWAFQAVFNAWKETLPPRSATIIGVNSERDLQENFKERESLVTLHELSTWKKSHRAIGYLPHPAQPVAITAGYA